MQRTLDDLASETLYTRSRIPLHRLPNYPPLEIDLRVYKSDGTSKTPMSLRPVPATPFLRAVARRFNESGHAFAQFGREVIFTHLPNGYSTFAIPRQKPQLWGHPRGTAMVAMDVIVEHFLAIICGNLEVCGCYLCKPPILDADAEECSSDTLA